ncbi:hypothetical protein Bca52824_013289 [Brassica carinata]|uniref:Uncharacterized protein n=1 Tax=Brassica carinata TaxID=52824 RepID=A0A8X7VYC0_BRACI|nr:hypothetical protein Bca52824_013289 [Brassica carinata]
MRKHVISSMEKKRQEEERARVHRFPSFQPGDFNFKNGTEASNNENAEGNANSSATNKYGSKEEKEEAETNVCLDLNLSL